MASSQMQINFRVSPTLARKRYSQASRILDKLKAAGPTGVMNTELNHISFRYSAHIFNLRKAGHNIKTECVNQLEGLFKFTFVSSFKGAENEGIEAGASTKAAVGNQPS